jgi:hypothetical protein
LVVPDAGSLELQPGTPYSTFQVRFHNHCAETIWPAWDRTGGLDQTVPDPTLWAPLSAGEDRADTIHYKVFTESAFWGRTKCGFDAQGKGSCETGDCGGFVCWAKGSIPLHQYPSNATIYAFEFGFVPDGYNVPLAVATPGCPTRECSFDLSTCPAAMRTTGACGGSACTAMCPSAASSTCCHQYANGCFDGGDVDFTFCP